MNRVSVVPLDLTDTRSVEEREQIGGKVDILVPIPNICVPGE